MIGNPTTNSSPSVLSIVNFSAAMLFLGLMALSIPWLGENNFNPGWSLNIMLPLWLLIILLSLWEFLQASDRSMSVAKSLVLIIAIPAFRISVTPTHPGWLWLPGIGWQQHNRALVRYLERRFNIPMLIIAALMIPLLAIEFFWPIADTDQRIRFGLNVATAAIWFAFAAEFIVSISVAPSKIRYCATHWLDLAIILLPVVSFLRNVRLLKLGRAAKMVRIYRLRGLISRALRALIAVDLLGRILRRTPQQSLTHLREKLQIHHEEIEELEHKIAALETLIASESNVD